MPRPFPLLGLALAACFTGESRRAAEAPTDTGPALDDSRARVDVLLMIDTSGSLYEESEALLFGVDGVIEALDGADWQLAVTTISARVSGGQTAELEPGEAGTRIGGVITPGANAADTLREVLACQTIPWQVGHPKDDWTYAAAADGSCPIPADGEVSPQYLGCLCVNDWQQTAIAGFEEGLEAAADALCERGGDVPEACFALDGSITEEQAGANADFWRPDALPRAVLISDEGDDSRRLATAESDPAPYLELFASLSPDFRLSVLGPTYHGGDARCLFAAQAWGVERYRAVAAETGGTYADLTDPADGCAPADVGAEFAALVADAGTR